jgi:hypothetical protein
MAKAKAAKKTATKKQIEKQHTDRPVSPTEDPTDHSTSAANLTKAIDPKASSGAAVNARSMDAVNREQDAKEDAERLEEDQSVFGKARRMGLFFVRDHSRGGAAYIGISPQNDPDADRASKERSLVEPLDLHKPQTGMEVRLKDGSAFTIPDGFGPGSTPADWARVIDPNTKKPLFA